MGRDMNFDVATGPQAAGVFLCHDIDVATEVLRYGLKLGRDLIFCVATEALSGGNEACRDKNFDVAIEVATRCCDMALGVAT